MAGQGAGALSGESPGMLTGLAGWSGSIPNNTRPRITIAA